MKVLIINYECPPLGGGGGVSCYQIAQELAKTHHVDYLTTGFEGLPQCEQRDGITIFRVPVIGRKDLSTATTLSMISFFPAGLITGLRLCSKNTYDAIHAHFVIPSGLPAVFLSKMFGVPLVISILGGDIYDPTKKWSPHRHLSLRKFISWLLMQADCVVAESRNMKENAEKYYTNHKEIEVIPLGFVQPRFQRVTRKDLGLPEDRTILISVGRLVKRKGYEYAIKAVDDLVRQGQAVTYAIIGDGPEEETLRTLVRDIHLEDTVMFLGYRTDEEKYQYLSNADIYILPSLHEGFGICLLEAMYCGLPIVATNNGGQTDILVDGRNAFLVPIKNSRVLAEKIDEISSNEKRMKIMASNNRDDIKKYDIQEIARRYEKIYLRHNKEVAANDLLKE